MTATARTAATATAGVEDVTAAHALRACPVCDFTDSSRAFLATDRHYGMAGEWWVRRCAGCESLFLEAPPGEAELASLYAPSYYAYHVARPSRAKTLLQRVLGYSTDTREPEFDRPGRVLDFGCGAGEFLLRMRERGWECAGVEINAGARDAARRVGLDVRPSLGGQEGFPAAQFDYVRANHSLEHVTDPAAVLREMWRVLKPGGTLFVGVPTTTSENARLFGASWWHVTAPLHTFVPSTAGLRALVTRAGFSVTRVATNGDYAGVAGSLQIALNRGTNRRSNQGIVFGLRPLLLLGHWYAKVQDLRGVGDKLELVAVKPA